MQNGDTLEHMMLWIQEEPVKGGILFVVSSVKFCYSSSLFGSPSGHVGACSQPGAAEDLSRLHTTVHATAQVVDTAAVTIMFPGAIFAMAGGAIFGVPLGCALVWVGTAVGQTLAFIVGR